MTSNDALRRGASVVRVLRLSLGAWVMNYVWTMAVAIGLGPVCWGPIAGAADAPAAGLETWRGSVMLRESFRFDGKPDEPAAVKIVGTRNGTFCGVVVVTSKAAMRGFRARMSGLRGATGGATIPASAVKIRYGLPRDWHQLDKPESYPVGARTRFYGFDGLSDRPPSVTPVIEKRVVGRARAPVGRAIQPVWVAVKVPADAATGTYEGTLTVTASGHATSVPVSLRVCGWRLPEPRDFRAVADLIQSPETLAMMYGAAMWSDEHFRLIGKSLALLGTVGDKVAYIHLVGETNQGNAETIVRWVPAGDGAYTYDFKPMHRYLDLVEKHCGKPAVVCLYVWDAWMEGGDHRSLEYWGRIGNTKMLDAWRKNSGTGPVVTAVDPATGKTRRLKLPPRTTPAGKAVWTHFSRALVAELAGRKLTDRAALGLLGDQVPAQAVLDALVEGLGDIEWVKQSHSMGVYNANGKKTQGWTVKYGAFVWHCKYIHPTKRFYGWKGEPLRVNYPRDTRTSSPVLTFRHMGEMNIAGAQRGFGRIGAEFWSVIRDSQGKIRGRGWITDRFPHACWKNLDIRVSMLAPGPDGAVSTRRFEMMREGLQECEARIFIEKALTDKALRERLGEDLASRCERVLTERNQAILKGFNITEPDEWRNAYRWKGGNSRGNNFNEQWYDGVWQDLSRSLFSTAEAVAARLAAAGSP